MLSSKENLKDGNLFNIVKGLVNINSPEYTKYKIFEKLMEFFSNFE